MKPKFIVQSVHGTRASIKNRFHTHYVDVIMGVMASQITSLAIVYSTVYWGANQRKHQSSASLAFVRGNHRGPVNSPHKGPVTRKMFHLMTSSWQKKHKCLNWRTKHSCYGNNASPWRKWLSDTIIGLHDFLGPLLLTWFNFNPGMDK